MAQNVLVNKAEHENVKVVLDHSKELGSNQWFSVTFPWEFRSIQAQYPIFFHKDEATGVPLPIALHGFQIGENLFLDDNGWNADYVPLLMRRQPFLIGSQKTEVDGVEKDHRVVLIDMDNPRVNTEEGAPLFAEHGGHSDYLKNISDMLETIHHGLNDAGRFISMLNDMKLIESVTLSITLKDGSSHELVGFYTINEETFDALSDEDIAQLRKAKYLGAVYYILASHSQVKSLIDLKNKAL